MKAPEIRSDDLLRNTRLHAIVFVIAVMSFSVNAAVADTTALVPTDYRIALAGDKFDGTRQYAVAFKLRPPRRLRARHLELAVGSISASQEDRTFISFGPVWRLPTEHQSYFFEFGFSPTLLSGSFFNGRDLGGKFHFTSSIAIGAAFGQRRNVSLSLRAQHTSNGGLNDTNPGIDMIGINFTIDLTNR